MDIFVHNLPPHQTHKNLKWFFQGPLRDFGINIFHIQTLHDTSLANITVLDTVAAQRFLNSYGVTTTSQRHQTALKRLTLGGKTICCRRSRNEPSNLSLEALRYEEEQQRLSAATAHTAVQLAPPTRNAATRVNFNTLECGEWDYSTQSRPGSHLTFIIHHTDMRQGHITFGQRQAIILLGTPESGLCRIDINYHDCIDIVLGSYEAPTVTFNLAMAPKFFEVVALEDSVDDLINKMAKTSIASQRSRAPIVKKTRLAAIDRHHAAVAGTCWVYRLTLTDYQHLSKIKYLLDNNPKVSSVLSLNTTSQHPSNSLASTFDRLNHELTDQYRFGAKPFMLRYQIERLARNGLLSPAKILRMIPRISRIYETCGLDPTVSAIRRLARELQYSPPGPGSQANDFSVGTLEELLEEYAVCYDALAPGNPYELARRHTHINLIHRIVVTPAGTYLEGPEPEQTNRVLRKYSDHTDHFARVVFQDEDGVSIRHDLRTSNQVIYHERFKGVLDNGIIICGQGFAFLGFSHSSLRAQACWFMRPMVNRLGSMSYGTHILKELGDFSRIRVPAKCAARIGQNFTDTNPSVELREDQVFWAPPVLRNGRDFSDGVGTISEDLLRQVWRKYGTKRLMKPTALQIRFQGCKGMVSLDPRLKGERLVLRSNMKKYDTDTVWNLEICGAAFTPKRMRLNRPLIQILETLGIPISAFVGLQNAAVNKLQQMTESWVNAAHFLDQVESNKANNLSTLIKHLGQIGIDYTRDDFLRQVVEMVEVSKLRSIKYKGQIPIEDGMTLYGVMDETGYLPEGKIFVQTEKAPEGGAQILVMKNILITRSPAMHPGDVQVVEAVMVPEDSALMKHRNVVVFSQHGERDLPSQLGGGDLDGDEYNIIWSPKLIPRTTFSPADYLKLKPVELNRKVEPQDMSNFFVEFMESDQLGRICTNHAVLADKYPDGVLHPNCMRLAEKASIAVDFSKTGIPVDMGDAPRVGRVRPDFMAPSPRIIVSDDGDLDLEQDPTEDDDALDGIDSEQLPYRYYKSRKALGVLFRDIDEGKFLAEMQRSHRDRAAVQRYNTKSTDVLSTLLSYVRDWTSQYGVMYYHHLDLAADIRANYEDSLISLLYDFEPSPHSPLSETEAYAGHILGRQTGVKDRKLRELNNDMRARFEEVLRYIEMRITKGDEAMDEAEDPDDLYGDEVKYDEREFEALPRAVACLEVAINETGYVDRKLGELKSFKYVAAGICLREMERYRITTFGRKGLVALG